MAFDLSRVQLVQAVGESIEPQLSVIIQLVKEGLAGKSFCPQALTCVSMLARAVGPKLDSKVIEELVGTYE